MLNSRELKKYSGAVALGLSVTFASSIMASDETELAKQSQNPVANIISLPFENNAFFDVGPTGKKMYTTNIKPVYPMPIGKSLNLINRVVLRVGLWRETQHVFTRRWLQIAHISRVLTSK